MKRKLVALSASTAFSLLLAESAVRLLPGSVRDYWFPKGTYQLDEEPGIGYRLSPGLDEIVHTPKYRFRLTTDDEGFRGRGSTGDSTAPLIAVFGDSYAFGQGVDDDATFPSLASRLVPGTRWVDTGVYGYRPSQEYRTYERLAARRSIAVVVLELCANDVEDQDSPIVRSVHDGYLNPRPPSGAWGELKNRLLLRSELAARLRAAYFEVSSRFRPRPDEYAPDFERRRAHEITTTKKILADWIGAATSRGQSMVVLYLPSRLQVDRSGVLIARWRREPGGFDPMAPNRWLGAFLREHPGVAYLDFTPIFRHLGESAGELLYIDGDAHLNERGNAVVAERLAALLRDRLP